MHNREGLEKRLKNAKSEWDNLVEYIQELYAAGKVSDQFYDKIISKFDPMLQNDLERAFNNLDDPQQHEGISQFIDNTVYAVLEQEKQELSNEILKSQSQEKSKQDSTYIQTEAERAVMHGENPYSRVDIIAAAAAAKALESGSDEHAEQNHDADNPNVVWDDDNTTYTDKQAQEDVMAFLTTTENTAKENIERYRAAILASSLPKDEKERHIVRTNQIRGFILSDIEKMRHAFARPAQVTADQADVMNQIKARAERMGEFATKREHKNQRDLEEAAQPKWKKGAAAAKASLSGLFTRASTSKSVKFIREKAQDVKRGAAQKFKR